MLSILFSVGAHSINHDNNIYLFQYNSVELSVAEPGLLTTKV